jgi:Fe-S-cluster containining protein
MPEGFCAKCQGKCCTEFTVYVTHADIKRLLDYTKWDPETFITAYGDDGRCTYPLVRMKDFEVRLGLTHNDRKCVFMQIIDGNNRCTVQAYKPMVCKTYPFSVTGSGKLVHVEP